MPSEPSLPDAAGVTIRAMTIDDYDAVMALMQQTPGVSIRDADSPSGVARYLQRNPGLSAVAQHADGIVGCLMAGHDGRRGYLNHLVVHPDHRGQGLAAALVEYCMDGLQREGILKSHLDVLLTNASAQAFWEHAGWTRRTDILKYSLVRGDNQNA